MGEMADYYDDQSMWDYVQEYDGGWPEDEDDDDEAWHDDPDRKRDEMRDGD